MTHNLHGRRDSVAAAARAIKLRHLSSSTDPALDFVCDPRGPVKMRRQCREGHPNKTRRRRGGEEEGTACMSQQPAMSSFSALEFHAGHLQRSRVSRLTTDDPAAILVNRFITPEESRVADTFSRRLSSAGRGPVIPFVSSTRLPNRNPEPRPKMMRRRFG